MINDIRSLERELIEILLYLEYYKNKINLVEDDFYATRI